MLCQNKYPEEYISRCETLLARQLQAYTPQSTEFEGLFFNNLVLVLEMCFVHRSRGQEGKDGNPLNEVRMLAASLLADGRFHVEKSIKYKPENSVLKLKPGDAVQLDLPAFEALATAYFAEIRRKFQ